MSGGWTPGPWRVDDAGDIVSGPYNVCIPYATKPEDKQMMAAAPTLYEALRSMVEYAQAMGMDGWDTSELSGEGLALVAARQALALARPSMEGEG